MMEKFPNLEAELNNNLSIQRANPQRMVETHINIFDENMKVKEGYEDAHELGAGYTITNCVFSPKDGKPVFEGTLNDGEPHLMMQFLFPNFGEEYDNFKRLDCYGLFTVEESNGLLYYSLDCGEDANKAAEIFTKVLEETFGVSNDFYDSFFTDKKGKSKDKAAKEARDKSELYGKNHKPSLFRNLKAGIDNAF